MAWNNSAEITVAKNGEVYFAPVGTALPTTGPAQALNAAFTGAGYIDSDGVTITPSKEVKDYEVWQSRTPVRRDLTSQDLQAVFKLTQWNEANVPFALGGGAVTSVGGSNYRYDFPEEGDALDTRALVIDWQDGSEHNRVVIPSGNVTEDVEIQLQRDEMAVIPVTFKALKGTDVIGYWLFDSTEFAAGS